MMMKKVVVRLGICRMVNRKVEDWIIEMGKRQKEEKEKWRRQDGKENDFGVDFNSQFQITYYPLFIAQSFSLSYFSVFITSHF